MLSQGLKVILSASISILAVLLYFVFKGRERKLCALAMLLCTLADVFMTDIVGIGDLSTYIGGGLFISAHIVYFLCFRGAVKRKGYPLKNKARNAGIALTALAAVLLSILAFTAADEPQPVMLCLLLVYLFIIGANLSAQYSYAFSDGGMRRLIALGMTLFLVSDFVVFLPMLNICPEHNDLVWFLYLPAQLLIVLFNSPFNTHRK